MSLSLIVLTSFYPAAQQAVRYAEALASTLNSRLVLLHVNRVSLYDPYVFLGEGERRQELRWGEDTRAELLRFAERLGVPATVEMFTDLLPEVVQGLAQRHHPALFVLGRPAAEDASPAQVSTVALELLAAQVPVLFVPLATAALAPPQRLLVAADDESFVLADLANSLFSQLTEQDISLTVAHVSAGEDDAACASALRAVTQSGLLAGWPAPALRGYQHEYPADGILAAIADTGADLVVLLARRRSYLGELFHRSVTAQVASRSPVPVLILPAFEPDPDSAAPALPEKNWLWPTL